MGRVLYVLHGVKYIDLVPLGLGITAAGAEVESATKVATASGEAPVSDLRAPRAPL